MMDDTHSQTDEILVSAFMVILMLGIGKQALRHDVFLCNTKHAAS